MANSSATSPEITSSRCITEHVTATRDFEMTNYLQLKGTGVGEFVSSPVFAVGGYDWQIQFYPDGLNSDGYTSSFLYYHSHAEDVRATFKLSMLETKGQEQIADLRVTNHVFTSKKDNWGYKKFVTMSKLKRLSRLRDGCFTIRCVLTVRKEFREPRPLELHEHLEHMLKDGRGADVTFSIGGQEFRARRSLLAARSPVFEAQLFDPTAEKQDMRRVEVAGMEPAIFEMMLHYIYTDSLPPCNDDDGGGYRPAVMQHLLMAADRYGLERLKQMCEKELCKRLDIDTVTITLAFANEHQCEQLKKTCVEFLSSKGVMADVVETEGFKEEYLKTCSPTLSLEEPHGEKATINRDETIIQARDLHGYVRK